MSDKSSKDTIQAAQKTDNGVMVFAIVCALVPLFAAIVLLK